MAILRLAAATVVARAYDRHAAIVCSLRYAAPRRKNQRRSHTFFGLTVSTSAIIAPLVLDWPFGGMVS
jgi:hypothetical protein